MRSLRAETNRSRLGGIVIFAVLVFLGFASFAWAQSQANQARQLHLQGAVSAEDFSQHMAYNLDPAGDLIIEDIITAPGIEFKPLETLTPHFGFTKDTIWLRVSLQNKTLDTDRWVLHVHENFLPTYRVYLQRSDGKIDVSENHSEVTRFSDRSVEFPELATVLSIAPGEKVTLFIAYSSGGSSNISLTLETEDSFSKVAIRKTSKNFISYGMLMIVIGATFISLLILRRRVFLSYFLYTIVILLFLMHSDGVTFQHLWPNAPKFNNYFSIIIGLAFATVPYDFAREFLRTRLFHPRWDKCMAFMMVATPVIIIPIALIDAQQAKRILMMLTLIAISLGTFVGLLAAFTRFKEVRFYVLAWFVGAGSGFVMNLRHFTNSAIGQHVELDSIRLAIIVDAIMMGLGVADRYSQQASERRKADAKNLEQAQLNLTLGNRLHDLEEQYRLAIELAQTKDVELKNTVHDIRQPLHALRLNVEKIRTSAGFEDADTKDLDTTFTYLENLIAGHLKDSVAHKPLVGADVLRRDDTVLTLSNILNSIHDMFERDASAKGLSFRFIDTGHNTDVEPIVLMRIVSNIVANAIKYTASGKVLMGVRSVKDKLRIEIHDTGPGLTIEEFEQAKTRSVRLGDKIKNPVEGSGLGLHIANELAETHGLNISILPNRQTGTSVAITVPKMG